MQFTDQKKASKYWLPVENKVSIQGSPKYPVILKHCPHISRFLK